MIKRYTLPEMGTVWSEQPKFQSWLAVEIAATPVMGTSVNGSSSWLVQGSLQISHRSW